MSRQGRRGRRGTRCTSPAGPAASRPMPTAAVSSRTWGAPPAVAEDWALAVARAAPVGTPSSPRPSRRLIGGLRSAPVPRVAEGGRRVAYLYDDGRGVRRLRDASSDGSGELRLAG